MDTAEKLQENFRHVVLISFDVSGTFNMILWSVILKVLLENKIPYELNVIELPN